MPTYLLHVSGRTIGRESGLRDIPIEAECVEDRRPFDAAMLATVRRCLPLPAGVTLGILWASARRARVTVTGADGRPSVAARFAVTDPTPADHQLGITLPPAV